MEYKWPEDKDKLVLHKYYIVRRQQGTWTVSGRAAWYGTYFMTRWGTRVENITKIEDTRYETCMEN
jgi:rare lipoprotein A (peptidoglycan hydrolase)